MVGGRHELIPTVTPTTVDGRIEMTETDRADVLARAYNRLVSLRDALAGMETDLVDVSYVHEFHGALDRVAESGVDVAEFRFPDQALQRATTSSYMGGSRPSPSGKVWAERALLLAKVSAVAGYFAMSSSEPKHPIGFRA